MGPRPPNLTKPIHTLSNLAKIQSKGVSAALNVSIACCISAALSMLPWAFVDLRGEEFYLWRLRWWRKYGRGRIRLTSGRAGAR
ncbi:hypothetical protein CPC08DRAFT_348919 [Agrocybe pediades]|nr:hypothetical protein CPC08DRAFT_348919 [Agrocybe pediades]